MSIALKIPKKKVTTRNRRDQRYRAVVHLGDNKYRKCPWRLLRSEAEADELAVRNEIRAGGAAPVPTRTVREYADQYELWYGLKNDASSLGTLKGVTRALCADLGDVVMADVTGEMAEAWSAKHRYAVRAVATMWKRAIARKELGVEWNPFDGLYIASNGREDIIPLSVAEVAQLAACAQRKYPGEFGREMAATITFDAYSGLRPGELFVLDWDAVDFDAQRIKIDWRLYKGDVDEPKRGPQIVRLFDEAAAALRGKPRGDGDRIFTAINGGPWTQSNFARRWKPVAEAFGPRADKNGVLALVTPYELRHFMGHHLYVTCGLPARVAAAQLGHKNENEIVHTYGHGEHGALEQLDRHFSTPAPLRAVGG